MELTHFSRVNSNLALIVEDLRMRQRGLNRELTTMKAELAEGLTQKKQFLEDVVETQHMFNDFASLKKGVIRLYKVWVLEECNLSSLVSKDSTKQYQLKRRLLEQKYANLKNK